MAQTQAEKDALLKRIVDAQVSTRARKSEIVLADFGETVEKESKAVIARSSEYYPVG